MNKKKLNKKPSKEDQINREGGDSDNQPKRRQYSKSLSSVGKQPPAVYAVDDKERKASAAKSLGITQTKKPDDFAMSEGNSPVVKDSGFLSTVRRSVSFSRRPSPGNRTGSGSSTSSLSRSGTLPARRNFTGNALNSPQGSPQMLQAARVPSYSSSPQNLPSILTTSANGCDEKLYKTLSEKDSPNSDNESRAPRLSNLFSRRSQSPSRKGENTSSSNSRKVVSQVEQKNSNLIANHSIDAALASSPSISDLNNSSPRFVTTSNPFFSNHPDGSNSSLSAVTKTMSGSSLDIDESEEEIGSQSSRVGRRKESRIIDEDNSRRNVSKWRKSLMMFNISGSNSENNISTNGDQLGTTDEALSVSRSRSPGSQSKSSWFRRMGSKEGSRDRSRDRSGISDSDDHLRSD